MPGMVQDPELPAIEALLGAEAARCLAPAVAHEGGTIAGLRPKSVEYTPGKSTRIRYDATVDWPDEIPTEEKLVALARHDAPPSGSIESEAGGMPIGVWRFPDDPYLPGIKQAMDPDFVGGLLEELGLPGTRFKLDVLGYSPRSRCVIGVSTRASEKLVFRPGRGLVKPRPRPLIYLKARQPWRAEQINRAHQLLAHRIKAADVIAFKQEQGILALEPLPGQTLWDAVKYGPNRAPEPEELIALLEGIEDADLDLEARATTSQTVPLNVELLRAIAPERAEALDRFLEAMGEDRPQPEITVHGDFHEAQLLVDQNRVSGVLDLDDAGRGQRIDDLAMMAGRLYCYSKTEPDSGGRVAAYTQRVIDGFSQHVDAADFHRRVAGVAMNHATGPFRFQARQWRQETRAAIDCACALQAQLVRG